MADQQADAETLTLTARMSKRDGKMEAPAVLIPETILQAGLDGCEVERGNTKASECVDTHVKILAATSIMTQKWL